MPTLTRAIPAATRRGQFPTLIVAYQSLLAIGAIGLVIGLVVHGERISAPLSVAGLAVAGAFAERGRVSLGANFQGSISLLPTVFAAAVFGPLAAICVAAGSYLGDLPPLVRNKQPAASPYLKWGIYTSIRAIYGAVAGLAAVVVSSHITAGLGSVVMATAAAALTAEPLDVAFAALTWKLRGGHALDVVRASAPVVAAAIPLYTPVVALLGISYVELSPWTLPLFFVPALAAQHLFGLYQAQRGLAGELASANTQLERANLSFASALVATLDARDRYTAGHSAAVAIYASDIAERMGLSEVDQRRVHLAGLVHDIGKIGLPAGLLEKAGALTLDERRLMESHPEIGERILAKVETYAEIAAVVRHHHERVDGQGYPDGLTGDDVPLLARIIAVADAYNAMTSDRPYRDAMPSRVARLRLAQAVGSQFDTTVVAAFEAILAVSSEEYRVGHGSKFRFEAQEELSAETPYVLTDLDRRLRQLAYASS